MDLRVQPEQGARVIIKNKKLVLQKIKGEKMKKFEQNGRKPNQGMSTCQTAEDWETKWTETEEKIGDRYGLMGTENR